MFWSGFVVGCAVGVIGITLYSCLVVASRADAKMEEERHTLTSSLDEWENLK